MKDLKIDRYGVLAIKNGDLVIIEGAEECAQNIRIRLMFFFGEWFLDERIGVKWREILYKPNMSLAEIELHVREIIRDTIGVAGISYYRNYFDTDENGKKRLQIEFTALYQDEDVTEEISGNEVFIL